MKNIGHENEKFEKIMFEAVQALCNSLERHYPGITKKTYEKSGKTWTFFERMMLGLNFELIFAEVIKDE